MSAAWRRRTVAVAALGLLLGGPPLAIGAAPARTVHLVPAHDVTLAVMMLVALAPREPVLLVDPLDRPAVEHFLASWRGARRCVARSTTSRGTAVLLRELAQQDCTVVEDFIALAHTLWPEAHTAVAASPGDYVWWLRAAAFAGATGSALVPLADPPPETEGSPFVGWSPGTLYLVPATAGWRERLLPSIPKVVPLPTVDAVMTEWRQLVAEEARVLVVANPADREGLFSPSSLSMLAPLVSTIHRAPLVLVCSREPDAIESEVLGIMDRHELHPSHVILVGDELALRSHRVPDPVLAAGGPEARGGGTMVRVELFSEIQREAPQDLVVGRMVAEDAVQGSTLLARQLGRRAGGKRRPVIFFANADAVFRLGEAISRTTVAEFKNVGVPVRAYYGEEIEPALVLRSLASTDLLVWEGHARDLTLEERGGIAAADAPDVVFLQGCYTFDRSDPFILMEKGAFAVVGTSTATYSAPGSALARAFFDAVLYDEADLGTATRNARNFLLALAKLQRARGHRDWRKTYRAALAFALWGDPTLTLDLRPGQPRLTPVRWQMENGRLTLTIPGHKLDPITVNPYRAEPPPRAMLGGLLLRDGNRKERRLKELYFTVQEGNHEGMVCVPGKGWNVVSLYAPRTRTLTVLARPDWRRINSSARAGTRLDSSSARAETRSDGIAAAKGGPFVFPVVGEAGECPAVVDVRARRDARGRIDPVRARQDALGRTEPARTRLGAVGHDGHVRTRLGAVGHEVGR